MAFNKAKAMQEAEKFVSQGKLSQAIRQYERILEKEPSDLILLNTVGDLYVREKNLPEALRNFHKLADSYSQEGFTLKAIAIYKKISKLDSNAIDVLVKTGDLYVLQGLAREARDQFVQAVDAFRKKTGTLLWSGTMDVRNVQNKAVITSIPVREVVKDWKPGAYVVVAWNAADCSERAAARSAGGTSRRSEERLAAQSTPWNAADSAVKANIGQSRACASIALAASPAHPAASSTWVTSMTFRRSKASTTGPPSTDPASSGTSCPRLTRPTMAVEPVRR